VAASAAAFAGALARPVRSQPAESTVTVGASTGDDVTEVLYGVHAGIFHRLGLNVEVNKVTNSAAVGAAIVGGSMQFGNGNVMTVAAGRIHNVPLEFVAPTSVYTAEYPYAAIVKKDSPIRSGRDFNGKVCAINLTGEVNTLFMRAWLDKNGGNSTALKFVEMPFSAMGPAVESGRADAALVLGPALQQAIDSGNFRVAARPIDALAYGKRRPVISAWFTSTAYASANPATVRAFSHGLLQSGAYCNRHHDETAPLIAEFSAVDVQSIQRSVRTTFAEKLDPDDVQPALDAMFNYKLTETRLIAKDLYSPAVLGPSSRR
jgi:NitT/TauT family transport system substrate-binding protein